MCEIVQPVQFSWWVIIGEVMGLKKKKKAKFTGNCVIHVQNKFGCIWMTFTWSVPTLMGWTSGPKPGFFKIWYFSP